MSRRVHIAVVQRTYAQLILSGQKTCELRLTKNRVVPFGRVRIGDTIYFKITGGPICARAVAGGVREIEDLSPKTVRALKREVNDRVRGEPAFWAMKKHARYATVIDLRSIVACDDGPDFSRERAANPRGAWLILDSQSAPKRKAS